jgi:hypothetical protein
VKQGGKREKETKMGRGSLNCWYERMARGCGDDGHGPALRLLISLACREGGEGGMGGGNEWG